MEILVYNLQILIQKNYSYHLYCHIKLNKTLLVFRANKVLSFYIQQIVDKC